MPLQGSQKIAVLLCRFSDSPKAKPNPLSFYEDLFFKRGTGGLNDYWVAASLGAINLDSSKVFDWKTLDMTRAKFLKDYPLRADRVRGAIKAFKLKEDDYVAFIAIFDRDVGDQGAVPSTPLILACHGEIDPLIPPSLIPRNVNVTFLAHEMGHVFGLDHSFDYSSRQNTNAAGIPTAQKGEYFDRHDLMSAMGVDSEHNHRFSPRGPLLNVANLNFMGWLPAARVWRPLKNSSHSYEIEIVALEHPEVPGYLAAQTANGIFAEFRMGDGFDAGIPQAAVLFHAWASPNSYIIASDPANYNHEWLPGQVWGPSIFSFAKNGGTRITVVSFDHQKKTARLRVQVRAIRAPFVEPDVWFGLGIGQLPKDGVILGLKNGQIVPIPIPTPGPEPIINDLRAIIRGHVLDILNDERGEGIAGFQGNISNDRLP